MRHQDLMSYEEQEILYLEKQLSKKLEQQKNMGVHVRVTGKLILIPSISANVRPRSQHLSKLNKKWQQTSE